MTIQDELVAAWKDVSSEVGGDLAPYFDIDFLADVETETTTEAEEYLQPWWTLYKLGVVWLVGLHLEAHKSFHNGQVPPIETPRTMLLGAAATYGVAIRRLALSGLDSPARVVLRSLSEILFTNLTLLTDANLARTFGVVRDEEEERNFWRREFSWKKIGQRLAELERLSGIPQDATAEFADFRKHTLEWLSRAVHPSYVGAVLTVLPRAAKDPEHMELGTFGRCGVSSFGTLEKACKVLWYFGTLGVYSPASFGSRLYYTMDLTSGESRMVLVAHRVFLKLVQEHWLHRSPYDQQEDVV